MPSPLSLTGHPQQRAGAWAVAILTDRAHPGDVTQDDLDKVVDILLADLTRSATAPKDGSGYDWWKVQNALYPNSKATLCVARR